MLLCVAIAGCSASTLPDVLQKLAQPGLGISDHTGGQEAKGRKRWKKIWPPDYTTEESIAPAIHDSTGGSAGSDSMFPRFLQDGTSCSNR